MQVGRFRLYAYRELGLYHRFGAGFTLHAGSLGSQVDDPRQNLFRDVRLFIGRRIFVMGASWKGRIEA